MAKKRKVGRPTRYKAIYAKQLIDFFDIDPVNWKDITITYKDGTTKDVSEEEANTLPLFSKFEKKIGISHQCLNEWKNKYKEFGDAYREAKRLQMEFIQVNGLRGNYNATFAIFTMKNVSRWQDENSLNWVDKTEVTGKDGKELPTMHFYIPERTTV